jgi:SAM-dependent methyltransferase
VIPDQLADSGAAPEARRTNVRKYALDNANPHGVAHLNGLSGLLDEFTRRRVNETAELAGARCLELGAGNGSVAVWLAEQVGPEGSVIAIDIEPRHVPAAAGLTVLQGDLSRDPLPSGPFDLIHARMVMPFLANRHELVPQLCAMLAPGGTLLIEDLDARPMDVGDEVLHVPADTPEVADLWNRYSTLMADIFTTAGTDGAFAATLHAAFIAAGLVDVESIRYGKSWRGGEPGSWWNAGALAQFRARLAERDFGDAEVDALLAALTNPDFHISGRVICSTSGHAPA